MKLLPKVLTDDPIFIILNSYAIRLSYLSLHFALKESMKDYSGQVQSGELSIIEEQVNPRQISTAIFSRWTNTKIS